ncbi:HD family phosphohydrolase [Ammoniphilus sp. CFH 90114]|uniref:HD family phosphohydrolase n=1 Tax=Ammoniphilus sp. CFH 90114 TaxID=2493665 RepID=UPI0013E97DA1|nr:HD family phosphohydrolase [Ammoniphilus sp. CFH 90114]
MKKGLLQGTWRIPETWRTSLIVRMILFFLLALGIYFLLLEHVIPKTYDLKENTISNVKITAPMEVEDIESTQKLREEAIISIKPIYVLDERILKNQLKVLDQIFRSVAEVRLQQDKIEQSIKNRMEATEGQNIEPSPSLEWEGEVPTLEDWIAQLKDNIPYQLSDETYRILLRQSPESLAIIKTISRNIVSSIMLEGVRMAGESQILERVDQHLATTELESRALQAVRELVLASLVPNVVFDEQATEQAKDKAVKAVKPILIHKGDILVGEGEYITEEIYRKLGVAGLLTHNPNYFPYFGLLLLVILCMIFFYLYIRESKLDLKMDNQHLTMFVTIVLLNLMTMKIVSLGQALEYTFIGFLAPVSFGSMLITLFLDQRLAMFAGVLFSVCASIIFNFDSTYLFDYRYGFVALAGCLAAVYALGKPTMRRNILLAGTVVIITNIVSITSVYMLFYSVKWSDLLQLYGFAVISGLLASVLTMGLIPFFESAFGILSTMKLIELSNPNHPLLRKLLMETPGTYHHSIMVANLSEAASEAIGANGLLARVGAYYHDVGKMKRPQFFIENQMGRENPHEKIAPSLSRTIIIAHPYDGVKMLQEYKLPKLIQDIAEQHHGTTLLKYFYHKAMQESENSILESEYRYPGPKAQFKESAIVGICDSVEAAVRSLSKPTPERVETLVRKIVKDRLDDGQFNECDLTFQELELITRSICETLQGIFHNRIEYPDESDVKRA